MVGIHSTHRRMAEITLRVLSRTGKYSDLDPDELRDLHHCLVANLELIQKLDILKSLSFLAYETKDAEWQNELAGKIESLEGSLY